MIIDKSLVTQIKVTNLERLDPITIIVEDIAEGQASITIKCFDKSWASYWGSMGGSVKDFFSRCNVGYLVNCFDRGIRSETDEKDVEAMQEIFNKKIREYILEQRREFYLPKEDTRKLWNEVDNVSFEDIIPEHDHECFSWNIEHYSVDNSIWRLLFDYKYELLDESGKFQQWLWDNVPFVYERNHEYDYLCRIVGVVKKVLSGEER